MKRTIFILACVCLVIGALFVFMSDSHQAQAQVASQNQGVDEGYNNDPYDGRGCVWRNDFRDDGSINYHQEEQQAPPEFYIESKPIKANDVCDFYSADDWVKLKDKGESALWPAGCFNPLTGVGAIPMGSFHWNTNYDTWDEFYYVAMGAYNKRQDPPNVDLRVATKSPGKGNDFTIIAAPLRYSSGLSKILFGWASKLPNQKFVSQQGLVAGGRELSEADVKDFNFPTGSQTNLDTCRRITRTVSNPRVNDTDNDGMDDNWEKRYAPNGDIRNFKPEDDPDNDGIDLTDPTILGQENKPLEDSEGTPIPSPDAYDGSRVTPDTTAKSAPGDGVFTNMEEYIWGTNPVDSDSDDDGFPDEADIVGLGQSSFNQVSEVAQGAANLDRMTYRVTTVGISTLVDEHNTGHKKILIDSDEKTIIAGVQEDLQASVYNVNLTPNATNVTGTSQLNDGKDVYVEADAFQTEGDKAVLEYAWYVEFRNAGSVKISDRVQVPPTPEFTSDDIQTEVGRLGRYTFRHPITELLKYVPSNYEFDNKSGSLIYITVEISNLVTHEFATKRIPISIGSDQTMTLQITDLNTGKTMAAEDYALQYCHNAQTNGFAIPSFCKLPTTSLNQILPWIVFQGSRVEVTAQPIQADQNNLHYEWYVNEQKVDEAFGPDSEDNKLVLYPEQAVKSYDIMVRGFTKDQYRNEIFNGQVNLAVEGPQVAIVSNVLTPVAGSSVQLTGKLLNFPEVNVASYTWSITRPDGSKETQTGKQISLPDLQAGTYLTTLTVVYQGDNNSQRTLTQQNDIVVGSGTITAQAKIRQVFASMASIVSVKSAWLYRFALVVCVVLVGLLTFLGYIRFKPQK